MVRVTSDCRPGAPRFALRAMRGAATRTRSTWRIWPCDESSAQEPLAQIDRWEVGSARAGCAFVARAPTNWAFPADILAMARVLIGTSGWHYDSWRGPFFPAGLPLKHQLQYYASQFRTTELNGVFYRTPSLDAVKAWQAQTGKDFVFAWKASKFITHWKRLSNNSVNSLALIEERLALLGGKAGPILFQLPPNFEADAERLAAFFKLLSKKRR